MFIEIFSNFLFSFWNQPMERPIVFLVEAFTDGNVVTSREIFLKIQLCG